LKEDEAAVEIVVIGNGVAGEAACSAIRCKTGEVKITLISEDSYLFYSPCILTQYISKEVKRSQVFLKELKDYEKERIKVLLGQKVEGINPSRKLVFLSGEEITYDKLILATGSQPIIPDISGLQKKGVRVLKSLRDADRLFRAQGIKAIIVGSGAIGVELAVALRKRNWEVSLIEVLDWILPNQFDEKGSSIVRKLLEKRGIKVLTGEKVLSVEGKAYVNGVVTSRTGSLEADLVVLNAGMRPSTQLAQQAGVEIGGMQGIRTNEKMETNVEDVYACGDCVEGKDPLTGSPKLSLLWPRAERQGRVAGCNCIGEQCTFSWKPDVVNLEVFGTFAGAMGQPKRLMGQAKKTEVFEREGREYYHCLVFSEGRLAGAQFIGDSEGMGVLLPFIGRDTEEIYPQIKDERSLSQFPWYYFARNFFS
jgi:NADH oxidase (H2O2-forming)